ncbi:hypothetical protein GCM10010424_29740 [Streptomyces lienomycini]
MTGAARLAGDDVKPAGSTGWAPVAVISVAALPAGACFPVAGLSVSALAGAGLAVAALAVAGAGLPVAGVVAAGPALARISAANGPLPDAAVTSETCPVSTHRAIRAP